MTNKIKNDEEDGFKIYAYRPFDDEELSKRINKLKPPIYGSGVPKKENISCEQNTDKKE